jgi:hypothetical protein
MPDVIYTEHHWVLAAHVPVDPKAAKRAKRLGSYRAPTDTKIDVLDVYCDTCKRNYDEVGDRPCEVTPWLHGGPIGTRQRRRGVIVQPDQVLGYQHDTHMIAQGG